MLELKAAVPKRTMGWTHWFLAVSLAVVLATLVLQSLETRRLQ